jgi:hypothetical protein
MRLDGRWALHPMLADTAGELFKASQLSFVPFSGTSFVSRSHFQAQDWMETGKRPDQRPDVGDGFLNRLAQVLGGQAISVTQNIPVALSGLAKVVNAPVSVNASRKNARNCCCSSWKVLAGLSCGGTRATGGRWWPTGDEGSDTNVTLHEHMACIALQTGQGYEVARVGELVKIGERLIMLSESV